MAISSQLTTIATAVYFILSFQDVGLIVEFNTYELMMFFGALHHMPIKRIRMKIQTLVELLEIPSLHQRIGTMR